MTTTLLAVAWSTLLALLAAATMRPRARGPSAASEPARQRLDRALLQRLGHAVARGAAQVVGRPASGPTDPGAIGAGVLLAVLVLVLLPGAWPVAVVLGPMPTLVGRAGRGRARAAAGRAVLDELPEVIDLLGLAVAAGLTAPLAVFAVGRRGSGTLAGALREASAVAASQGRRLADVLDDAHVPLGEAGDGARPLLAALADSARHGTALGPSLDRLAAEARTVRRHRAEERARRVPILLLFPLVTCTLPALGLLTIAPLAVGALRDLRA